MDKDILCKHQSKVKVKLTSSNTQVLKFTSIVSQEIWKKVLQVEGNDSRWKCGCISIKKGKECRYGYYMGKNIEGTLCII